MFWIIAMTLILDESRLALTEAEWDTLMELKDAWIEKTVEAAGKGLEGGFVRGLYF